MVVLLGGVPGDSGQRSPTVGQGRLVPSRRNGPYDAIGLCPRRDRAGSGQPNGLRVFPASLYRIVWARMFQLSDRQEERV